jgi:hypothetical protein
LICDDSGNPHADKRLLEKGGTPHVESSIVGIASVCLFPVNGPAISLELIVAVADTRDTWIADRPTWPKPGTGNVL